MLACLRKEYPDGQDHPYSVKQVLSVYKGWVACTRLREEQVQHIDEIYGPASCIHDPMQKESSCDS